MRLFPLLIAPCVVVVSCSTENTNIHVIEEQKFINFYAHLMILQEEAKLMGLDSTATRAHVDSLYQAYHLTDEQIKTSLDEYKKDLSTWKRFHDKVIQRLEQIQKEETNKPRR
ncbi:MAG: hypothetical protein HY707_00610 [Ignavibacteriae bacterium]|nr:hypothetical protein [Ignavibacteriota bacterium]